jgi:carbamate kinase
VLAPLARPHELIIAHSSPLSAELLHQELANEVPRDVRLATVLMLIDVTPGDTVFEAPRRLLGLEAIETLLEAGFAVVCRSQSGEAIDRDLETALLAIELGADALLTHTDVDAVYADWGTPQERAIRRATPTALAAKEFAERSMAPKVRAACSFVQQTGGTAAIGSLDDVAALLRHEAGTVVSLDGRGLEVVHG